MHALACEVVRALMKLGIAIAASKPMMATTIMISTSVKPARREFLSFIRCTFLSGGVNEWYKAGLNKFCASSTNCLLPTADRVLETAVPTAGPPGQGATGNLGKG